MNKIRQEVDLTGLIENITMMQLRNQPGEVLTQAGLGKTFIISRAGKPIAFITKLPEVDKPSVSLGVVINNKGKISGYTV